MTLQELSDWIYAEYEAKYNEMERTDDRLEQIMLEGFTDGLLHVMAYLQPCIAMVQAEEKPQKKKFTSMCELLVVFGRGGKSL